VILYSGKLELTFPKTIESASTDDERANYISFIEQALQEVFSIEEQEQLKTHFPKLIFSSQQIHGDDSIRILKKKLLRELGIENISYPEIYLYGKVAEPLHFMKFFYEKTRDKDLLQSVGASSLSMTDDGTLTKNMVGQLFMNLGLPLETVSSFQEKNQTHFSYDDIYPFLESVSKESWVPLGQNFAVYSDYLFSSNPYDVLPSSEPTFQYSVENALLTFENQLLFSYGEIVDKTIYFCLTEDVLRYAIASTIPESYMLRLYYPLLVKENITSSNDFRQKKGELIEKNKGWIKIQDWKNYDILDTFYDIYNNQDPTRGLPYTKVGISSFKITLHPEWKTTLPLEYIFKQFHATKQIPFLKYNPGVRKENIYRLYSEKTTRSGKKIPFLSKGKILQFAKQVGKSRQVSLYLQHTIHDTTKMDIFIDFDYNGNIAVRSENYNDLLSVSELNDILIHTTNKIIQEINEVLQQSGYQLSQFENLEHKLVEIESLNYVYHVTLSEKNKDVFQKKYTNCISPMFDILEVDESAGAQFRLKRVENYKKMDAISAMITRIYNATNSEQQVVQALMTNFTMTEEEALLKIAKYLNEFIQIQGRYVNKSTEIADNPGIPVHFQYSLGKRELYVDIYGINKIAYIDTLHIYLDGFLRLSQAPDSAPEKISALLKRCQKMLVEKEETLVENVIAPSSEINTMNIVNEIQPIKFGKQIDTLFLKKEEEEDEKEGLFFEEEEEEEEEEGKLFFEEEEEEEEEGESMDLSEPDVEEEPTIEIRGSGRQRTRDVTEDSNIFYRKMRNLEPTLFLSTAEKPYGVYSRVCPANISRQPVILTQEEKEKIDREHSGSYTHALEYGSNPDKKYWYICPRYWCITSNTTLTEDEVKQGVCKGHVHEFTDNAGYHKDSEGNYVNYSPGFMKKDQHPKGYCIPCCFKNWNSKSQIELREKCGVTKPTERKPKKQDKTFNYYIMGHDKFPIPQDRWGYLPLVVELFLQTDNSVSMNKKNNAQLQEDMPTLLRYGVEASNHQSFLACIADIYGFSKNKNAVSISEIKTLLHDAISLDIYVKCNHGSLVSIFQPKKYHLEEETILTYYSSDLYKSIDIKNTAQREFFEDTIASFENFKSFLADKDSWIDHTYLWDLVTLPNEQLFPTGINLVILEIVDNDITDNIQLLCPTNSYAETLFDPKKKTVLLLKQDRYYEPIYLLTDSTQSEGKIKITKWFDYDSLGRIPHVLSTIEKSMGRYCSPRESMPRVYKYKKNITLLQLYNILKDSNFDVGSQVVNYRGKIIGVLVNDIYVPCFPSLPLPNLTSLYTDDVTWSSYRKTRDFLKTLSLRTSKKVLSHPAFRVIEDDLVVGILTETNQFIPVDPPLPNDFQDDLEELAGTNYMLADKVFATNKTQDAARVETTKKIKLETQFFIAFRSTVRILLHQRENREWKEEIHSVLKNANALYRAKLTKLEKILRKLCENAITFGDLPSELLNNMTEIASCISSDSCSNKKYCITKENGMCSLFIPRKNLLNHQENEKRYFLRMADELLRYPRVRLFMLDTKNYLNITSLEYRIREDEFIILQTLLMSDYFDDLVPFEMNTYVKNIPYEYANPIQSQKYSNRISIVGQELDKNEEKTNPDFSEDSIKERFSSVQGNAASYWVKMFPPNTKEIALSATRQATFYVAILVLQEKLDRRITIAAVSQLLVDSYLPYLQNYSSSILKILSTQGKKTMMDRIKKHQTTFEDMIMSEEYFLTDFDYWVLASSKLNLPIVLFTATKLHMMEGNLKWLLLGGDRGDAFYFLRSPTEYLRRETRGYPGYQYIESSMKLNELRGFTRMMDNPLYIQNVQSIETYLNSYTGVSVM
jgi:ribosomal protein S8